MKTYSKIMMLAAVAVLTACGNEFLNIRSTSADVLEDYYKTEAQIYKTLVGAYDPLQWSDYYGGYNQFMFLSDLRGDDIYVGGDKGSDNFFHQMQRFQMQPIDAPRSFWENMYTRIYLRLLRNDTRRKRDSSERGTTTGCGSSGEIYHISTTCWKRRT